MITIWLSYDKKGAIFYETPCIISMPNLQNGILWLQIFQSQIRGLRI